jgi:hypothetical protein
MQGEGWRSGTQTVAWRLPFGAVAGCEVHLTGDDPDRGPPLQPFDLLQQAAQLLAKGTDQLVRGFGAIFHFDRRRQNLHHGQLAFDELVQQFSKHGIPSLSELVPLFWVVRGMV